MYNYSMGGPDIAKCLMIPVKSGPHYFKYITIQQNIQKKIWKKFSASESWIFLFWCHHCLVTGAFGFQHQVNPYSFSPHCNTKFSIL